MTDAELADEIERGELVILALTVPQEIKEQIIAALRRPATAYSHLTQEQFDQLQADAMSWRTRQPSSDQVLVPREPTQKMLAAMVGANVTHDQQYPTDGVRRSERIYRAMISAAEAEGEKT